MNYSFSFKKILACFILFSTALLWRGAGVSAQNNNVGIGTVTPAPSALLDLTANDRGFLAPRVADTNLITSPATGLLIYLTTNNKFYYFNGTFWQALSIGIGINGTMGATGLIGTTGITGDIGVTGATGLVGNTGFTGTTGDIGATGTTGSIGSTGLTGTTGDIGMTGATGFIGTTGHIGTTGSIGVTGATGPVGCASPNYVMKSDGVTAICTVAPIFEDGAGLVGIGTVTPAHKMHVMGNVIADNANTLQSAIVSSDGGVELYRSTSSSSPTDNGYIDFKSTSGVDYDYRIAYDSALNGIGALSLSSADFGNIVNFYDNGQVVVGSVIPDSSAMLDVRSTNRGLLIPRVALTGTTDITTITGAATSLQVYNTATAGVSPNNVLPGFYYWNGTKWVSLSGGTGGNDWSLLGNAGTTATSNFLGTTDNKSLRIRTNNNQRMIVDSTGNVGIGTTSPLSKLHIASASAVVLTLERASNLNSVIEYKNSNVGSMFAGLSPSNNFGIGTTDNLGSGSAVVTVTPAGFVGIGTVAPTRALDVNNVMLLSGSGNSATEADILFDNAGSIVASESHLYFTSDGDGNGSGDIVFKTGAESTTSSTELVRVTSDGYVGIGTASPDQMLELNGGGIQLNGTYGIGFNADSVSNSNAQGDRAKIYYDNSLFGSNFDGLVIEKTDANNLTPDGGIAFSNKGSDNVRNISLSIRGTGNVGIGTATPTFSIGKGLHISGSAGVLNDAVIRLSETSSALGNMEIRSTARGTSGNRLEIGEGNDIFMVVRSDDDAGGATLRGNVGIGTSAPSEKLEVCGNLKVIGTINASSTINASQSISCSSDVRFKKNITPLPNALTNVMKLQGVNYNWKVKDFPEKQFTDTKQIGFIAQELEKIYPEMVITDKEGYKSVDYSRLTPVLVEAIKEQQKQIKELQDRLEKLEKK